MPTNKGALIRRQILDSCLSQNREYTLLQLMDKCNEALREHGFKLVTSENTIRTDLEELQAQYPQAEVVPRRSGRNILYRYKEKNFSIYKLPLTHEEILGLTQAISVLSRFDGMPGYDWLDSLIERFKPYISIDTSVKNFVGFDDNFDLKGREHFAPLLKAIASKQVLLIRYSGYHNPTEISAIFHPYYIKQYNNRWFLFGYNEERGEISNFAFDRIIDFTIIPRKYIENSETDFFEFFDDMIGVSRNPGDEPQEVQLSISKNQLPYIVSKPLHGTQRMIEKLEDGAIIAINVILNYELEQTILSLGEHVKVLSPAILVDKIKKRISDAQKNYQYTQ